MTSCRVESCEKEPRTRTAEYCAAHYAKFRRYGDPEARTPEKLFWAKVQKSADCWLWVGAKDNQGYGHFKSRGSNHMAHRYAYERLVGPIEPELVLDHFTCFNRSCVNPAHLRQVTQAQNAQNRAGAPKNNTSGYRGVSFESAAGAYSAKFRLEGKDHFLGFYSTSAEAHEVVTTARREHMTHSEMDKK